MPLPDIVAGDMKYAPDEDEETSGECVGDPLGLLEESMRTEAELVVVPACRVGGATRVALAILVLLEQDPSCPSSPCREPTRWGWTEGMHNPLGASNSHWRRPPWMLGGRGLQLMYLASWCVRRDANRSVEQPLTKGEMIIGSTFQSLLSINSLDSRSATTLVFPGTWYAIMNRLRWMHQFQSCSATWRSSGEWGAPLVVDIGHRCRAVHIQGYFFRTLNSSGATVFPALPPSVREHLYATCLSGADHFPLVCMYTQAAPQPVKEASVNIVRSEDGVIIGCQWLFRDSVATSWFPLGTESITKLEPRKLWFIWSHLWWERACR